MGFISFHEKYYLRELSLFEDKELDEADIYKVKQLLKVLDDLNDEGYVNLNNYLEAKYRVITRLRSILSLHGEEPFRMPHLKFSKGRYSEYEFELAGVCSEFIDKVHRLNNEHCND